MDGTKRLMWSDEVETELRAYADRKHACGQPELANGILKAVNHIQTITTAKDAVEVIRCKDCINYGVNKPGYGFCEDLAVMRKDCDFCSRGERKDNDT
jgi:hypothetical protein